MILQNAFATALFFFVTSLDKDFDMENIEKDYNTTRSKLRMSEYGRHVQDMIEYVTSIPDKDKRNEQIKAVVSVMGALQPQLKDMADYKHKLWDHVHYISDYKIDIDSPFPVPERESINAKPQPIPLERRPIRLNCYGRNIQNMIDLIAQRPDDDVKKHMIKVIASYMKQQYLIWNKDSVAEETIFADIKTLSGGKLIVPDDIHIGMGLADATTRKPQAAINLSGDKMTTSAVRTPMHKKMKPNNRKWKK